jgi:hypothetical protein
MLPPEDTRLADHPFRGLWLTSTTILIALLLTSICWCIWAYVAHRGLQSQIDAIAAMHQPFNEADFPDANRTQENGSAILWRTAFAAVNLNDTCPSASNFTFNDYPPFPAQWQQMENQSIAANVKLFNLVHRAAATDPDWSESTKSLFANFPFSASRGVANITADAVLHAHLHGDDARAIRRTLDLLQLSRADSRIGNLIGRLVGIGIECLCLDRLQEITPDLLVEGDPPNPKFVRQSAVSRADIQSLIDRLLDDADENRCRLVTIDYERLLGHQDFQLQKKPRWTLGPLIDLSDARVLKQRIIDRLAAQSLDEPAARQVLASNLTLLPMTLAMNWQRSGVLPANGDWAGVYESYSTSLSRYLETEWRSTALRRSAAIALAIRLYRVDHQTWPARLSALVPDYLPAIPADPYFANGAPVGYIIRQDATPVIHDRPLLYFNLVGDAKTAPLPPAPNFGWMQGTHQWIDLSRWYPVPTTTTSSP